MPTDEVLTGAVPGLLESHHFQLLSSEEAASCSGIECHNDKIPYQGSVVDCVNSIVDFSDSIKGINCTCQSKGSDQSCPSSSHTAAVNDVSLVRRGLGKLCSSSFAIRSFVKCVPNNGMLSSDMATEIFWIASKHLRLTSFATPIVINKVILAVRRPTVNHSLGFQTRNSFQHFEPALWCVSIASTIVAAMLWVWFTSPTSNKQSMAWLKFKRAD